MPKTPATDAAMVDLLYMKTWPRCDKCGLTVLPHDYWRTSGVGPRSSYCECTKPPTPTALASEGSDA